VRVILTKIITNKKEKIMAVSSENYVSLPIEKEIIEKFLKPQKEAEGVPLYQIVNNILRDFYADIEN
jgi:hypothetical protein